MSHAPVIRNPQLDGSAFYWQAGSTGVLLLHGFSATTTEVRLLASIFYKEGFTVSGPLLPGHGTSPQDCNRHTWQDWYACVEQSYHELAARSQNVVIGGESTGALLALQCASLHPEVAAILCYAPALRLMLSRAKIFLLTLCMPFISSIPKPPSSDDLPWNGYAVNPLKGAYQLPQLQNTIYHCLAQVHQPIMIMQGRLDTTVHPQSPRIIYDQVSSPIKELHWLEHSTHCLILDKELDVAARLSLDFLQRVLT